MAFFLSKIPEILVLSETVLERTQEESTDALIVGVTMVFSSKVIKISMPLSHLVGYLLSS